MLKILLFQAEARAVKGEAEAYAIEVKAKAEAEQVRDFLLFASDKLS